MPGCIECGAPCEGARCPTHAVEHAAPQFDAGPCPDCGQETVPGGVRCSECLHDDADDDDRLRADGGSSTGIEKADIETHDLDDRSYQIIRETDRRALFEGKSPNLRDAICWCIDTGAFYPREEVTDLGQ